MHCAFIKFLFTIERRSAKTNHEECLGAFTQSDLSLFCSLISHRMFQETFDKQRHFVYTFLRQKLHNNRLVWTNNICFKHSLRDP